MGFRFTVVTADADPTQPSSDLHIGNNRWSAPEVMNGGETNKETDIFSLAMVMIEVGSDDLLYIHGRVWLTVVAYFYRYSPEKSHSMTSSQF